MPSDPIKDDVERAEQAFRDASGKDRTGSRDLRTRVEGKVRWCIQMTFLAYHCSRTPSPEEVEAMARATCAIEGHVDPRIGHNT